MSLFDLIRDEIKRDGPIGVARYMELALLHPEFGYYQRKNPFGAAGDFVTAPEISQIFGEMAGIWCADWWQRIGSPRTTMMELGPGRGTLMQDALRATSHVPGFHDAVDIMLVEASDRLRNGQAQALQGKHPRIHWQPDLEPLPKTPLLIIANEFFDALPIRQFVRRSEKWKEVKVGAQGDQLVFVEEDIPFGRDYDEGKIIETCEPGESIVQILARHIKRYGGAMLIIDYGYANGTGDTLQAVQNHQYVSVLDTSGEADITAHVDFGALAQVAGREGLTPSLTTQGGWLRRMGAELRATQLCKGADMEGKRVILSGLERIMSPNQMGELFMVMECSKVEN